MRAENPPEDHINSDDMSECDSCGCKMCEACNVCDSMCDMWSNISELHSAYAGSLSDYLKRRADQDPNRDSDNQQTNPARSDPDVSPMADHPGSPGPQEPE